MHESEIDPTLERDIEIELSLDPEIVTQDTPLVDRKERVPEIEEEAEELEEVEADL